MYNLITKKGSLKKTAFNESKQRELFLAASQFNSYLNIV